MCRIVGFRDFNTNRSYRLSQIITTMRDTLTHGGPDAAGRWIDEQYRIALGHRRLSIIDLSKNGTQPMISQSGRYIITYNGEIYNYQELRRELQILGYSFASQTDTEVVLHAYEEWGIDCFNKFIGMWACALWDTIKKELILVRDRIGVKPLYWYFHDSLFLFASELKAFHRHPHFIKELNRNALSLYLSYGYIPAPHTIFNYCHKLEPGHALILRSNGVIDIKTYWDLSSLFVLQSSVAFNEQKSDAKVEAELEALLTESFEARLHADVPVGIFLSGGIDSSLLTALLSQNSERRLRTFTVGFHEAKYDESRHARAIASHLGTDHSEVYCTSKDARDILPQLPYIYDEPFSDPSSIPTVLLSRYAKRSVSAILSADGGDEEFFGYRRYALLERFLSHRPQWSNILVRMALECGAPFFSFFRPELHDRYNRVRSVLHAGNFVSAYDAMCRIFFNHELRALGITPSADQITSNHMLGSLDHAETMMYLDLTTYLPDDILVKVDRATMSVGLESREPFLDHRIIDYSAKLSLHYKYRDHKQKYILKRILSRYLPKEIVERKKQSIDIPVASWLTGDLSHFVDEYLSEQRIRTGGLFDVTGVQELKKNHAKKKGGYSKKLWLLLTFQMWAERWLP